MSIENREPESDHSGQFPFTCMQALRGQAKHPVPWSRWIGARAVLVSALLGWPCGDVAGTSLDVRSSVQPEEGR